MIGRALRRLAAAIAVVWFAVTVTFLAVTAIPADPARAMLGPHATPETIERVRAFYCLDDGALVQYGCWLENLLRGDLGESYRSKRPVADVLADRIVPTIQLALAALLLQLALGIPLGTWAAARRGRWPDHARNVFGVIAQSAPAFVVATVLLYVVAYRWQLLPIGGYGEPGLDRLAHLVLPALSLATFGIAYYANLVRGELGDVLDADYIRTARAKGLPERTVIVRHGLRNALQPVVAVAGVDLAILLGGAVVVESIFAWPGLGRELVRAILEVDVPLMLGVVLVSAIAVAAANLLADLVAAWLDPRLRD